MHMAPTAGQCLRSASRIPRLSSPPLQAVRWGTRYRALAPQQAHSGWEDCQGAAQCPLRWVGANAPCWPDLTPNWTKTVTVCLKLSCGPKKAQVVPAGTSGGTGLRLDRLEHPYRARPRGRRGNGLGEPTLPGWRVAILGAQRRCSPRAVCLTSGLWHAGSHVGGWDVRDTGPANIISASSLL